MGTEDNCDDKTAMDLGDSGDCRRWKPMNQGCGVDGKGRGKGRGGNSCGCCRYIRNSAQQALAGESELWGGRSFKTYAVSLALSAKKHESLVTVP